LGHTLTAQDEVVDHHDLRLHRIEVIIHRFHVVGLMDQ
jgi:hypothetical protein